VSAARERAEVLADLLMEKLGAKIGSGRLSDRFQEAGDLVWFAAYAPAPIGWVDPALAIINVKKDGQIYMERTHRSDDRAWAETVAAVISDAGLGKWLEMR
jgi:hypothetical protein